jgi:hypothetical protein
MAPVNSFFTDAVFDPETTRAMGIAFERACHVLGLSDRSDPATALVAQKIIVLARRGVHDPNDLWLKAVGMVKGISS